MRTRIKLLAFLLFFSCVATGLQAAEKSMSREQTEMRVMEITQRAEQIKAMDLKHLSATERKGLRHELKDMNKELRSLDPGYIYISTGALILIIILLVLLL